MPIEPIKRSAISEDVTMRIMEMIRHGELRPGDKLPSERQLAEAFGVSRVSLREGLRTLAFMNILDVRPGDGTYVSSLESHDLIEPLTMVLELNDKTILELTQARQLIEPFLAAQAARFISDEELAALHSCVAAMEAAGDDYIAIVEQDVELHRLIAQAAQNTFLYRFIATLTVIVMRRRRELIKMEGFRERVLRAHRRIVEAIGARHPEAARQAMMDHLSEVATELDKDAPIPTDGLSE